MSAERVDDRMSGTTPRDRVTRREFLMRVAERSGRSLEDVTEVYDAFVNELIDDVVAGDVIVLTGFGKFYRQDHKGHRVHFGQKTVITDYEVFKFSAARGVNRSVNSAPAEDPETVFWPA